MHQPYCSLVRSTSGWSTSFYTHPSLITRANVNQVLNVLEFIYQSIRVHLSCITIELRDSSFIWREELGKSIKMSSMEWPCNNFCHIRLVHCGYSQIYRSNPTTSPVPGTTSLSLQTKHIKYGLDASRWPLLDSIGWKFWSSKFLVKQFSCRHLLHTWTAYVFPDERLFSLKCLLLPPPLCKLSSPVVPCLAIYIGTGIFYCSRP